MPGIRLIQADLIGTAAFIVTAVLRHSAAAPIRSGARRPASRVRCSSAAASLSLGDSSLPIERSRTEEIELSSLFFLKESAPAKVRQALLGLMTVQVVVAIVTASVRPFTSLAFGVLAPVWGLGIITLWSGRYGRIPVERPGCDGVVAHRTEHGEAEESSDATMPAPRSDPGETVQVQPAASATTDEDRPE